MVSLIPSNNNFKCITGRRHTNSWVRWREIEKFGWFSVEVAQTLPPCFSVCKLLDPNGLFWYNFNLSTERCIIEFGWFIVEVAPPSLPPCANCCKVMNWWKSGWTGSATSGNNSPRQPTEKKHRMHRPGSGEIGLIPLIDTLPWRGKSHSVDRYRRGNFQSVDRYMTFSLEIHYCGEENIILLILLQRGNFQSLYRNITVVRAAPYPTSQWVNSLNWEWTWDCNI